MIMEKDAIRTLILALLNVLLLFIAHLINSQILILGSLVFMILLVLISKSKYFLSLMLFYLY